MSRSVETAVTKFLAAQARLGPLEIVFWLAAFAAIWLAPTRHLILTEIAIWGLFAVSLDLILGYAGIISLGHAAFFGVGAYAAGLIAKYGIIMEPTVALVAAGLIAAVVGFATSFLVLRGTDLTRLMVTLGVALVCFEIANKLSDLTGGADGLQGVTMAPILKTAAPVFNALAPVFDALAQVLGIVAPIFERWAHDCAAWARNFAGWRFDMFGHNAYVYALAWLFVLFMLARRIVNSPFGLSLKAIRGNVLRASAVGIAVNWRLVAVYTLSAGYAGIAGGLLAQTQSFASLSMLSIDRSADGLLMVIIGGTGYLYGGIVGALIYRLLQDFLSTFSARFWQYWIGFALIMMVLFGRVYGGIIAAVIIGATIWFDMPPTTSFLMMGGSVLMLGILRDPLMKLIASAEDSVARGLRRVIGRSKSTKQESLGHGAGT